MIFRRSHYNMNLVGRQKFCREYNFTCNCEACTKNYPLKCDLPRTVILSVQLKQLFTTFIVDSKFSNREAAKFKNKISKLSVEHDHHYPCYDLYSLEMFLMESIIGMHSPETFDVIFAPKP